MAPLLMIMYDASVVQVFPLSIIFVTMMTYNNLCLKHLGVSFYYVGRSLVHLFNVMFTWYILGNKTILELKFPALIALSSFVF